MSRIMKSLLNPIPKPFSTLQTNTPITSLLHSRSVIRFRGPDTVKFLQNLLTNDIRKTPDSTSIIPTPNIPYKSTSPVYAAMLTPQGRFLYDFFLYVPPKGDGEVELFADVDAAVLDELLDTLIKYRLRSKVDIENMSESFSCWQRYGSDPSKVHEEGASVGWGGTVDQSGVSASRGNNIGWRWYNDPRLSCLGFRGIFPSNSTPPLVEADKEADERNYLMWRIENGVAEGSTEIPKGEAMPLEYNFVGLNAISFDKGCYVGQELIARTHHRGVIRKRLLPLKFVTEGGKEVEQKVAPGSEVINSSTHKKVGYVTTALGSRGLGLLRLEEAFKDEGSLTIQGNAGVKVEAIRPKWWPSQWILAHQH